MDPTTLLGQAARQMNAGEPALSQVSNTAPTFQPSLAAPAPTPMPNKSPMDMIHGTPLHRAIQRRAAAPQQPAPTAQPQVTIPVNDANKQQPGVQVPASEAELIIKALTSRLQMIGKHESAVRDSMFPQDNEAAEAEAQ